MKAYFSQTLLDQVYEGEKYYALMDDIIIPITNHDNKPYVCGYTKLYGDCKHYLQACTDDIEYTILDQNDKMAKTFETLVMTRVEGMLCSLRARHHDCSNSVNI